MVSLSRALVLLAALGLLACRDLPTSDTGGPAPSLRPGPSGPTYAMVTMNLPAGYSSSTATEINSRHEVIGNASGMAGRQGHALYWDAGTTLTPVLLPEVPGTTASAAAGINEDGIIAGGMNDNAVLWVPNGGTWDIVPLAGGTCTGASDVARDRTAVGSVRYSQYCTEDPLPAVWDPAGVLSELPLPASGPWTGGAAYGINADGDISGTMMYRAGASYWWGGLWIRDANSPSGYLPLAMQTGPAYAVADRAPDGKIRVIATGTHTADLFTFTPNGDGTWSRDSVALPGLASDINPAGDVSGTIEKGGFGTYGSGYPYITTTGGVTTRLPIPKNTTGVGQGVSSDRWVTGVLSGRGVLWKLNP